MKSRKVLVLMAVITAMTVSVCGCGKKDAAQEIGTELAAAEDTEQPAEADPKETEETEDTEELQIEAAVKETEEVATSQPEDSVKEMSATKYAKSTVNVRKGPSADTEKLGGLSTNQKVTVTGQADNGWYRIDFNGQSGFVSDQYLSDEKVTAASGNSKDKTNNTGAAGNTGSEAQGNAGTQAASGTGTAAQGNTGTQEAGNTSSSGSNSGNTAGSGSTDTGNSGSAPADNGNANGLTPDQQDAQKRNEEMKKQDEEFEYDYVLSPDGFEPATDGYGDGAVITVQPTP